MEYLETEEQAREELTREFAELKSIRDVEIFGAGKWNGDTYTVKDLDAMVAAFDEVGFRPPIKLGHGEKSGGRAYGWVERIRRKGDKLVADFMDLPDKVYQAIKDRAFDAVSSEIWFNIERDGKKFPRALKAVALLGSEIPGANLKPLREAAFDQDDAEVKQYDLTIKPHTSENDEDDDMSEDIKSLKADNDALREQIKNLTQKLEDGDKSEEVKNLQASLEASENKIKRLEESNRRNYVDSQVKRCNVPAYHDTIRALFGMAETTEKQFTVGESKELDGDKVVEQFIDQINSDSEKLFKALSSTGKAPISDENPRVEADRAIRKYMEDHNVSDYMEAQAKVFAADPDLKQRYAEA